MFRGAVWGLGMGIWCGYLLSVRLGVEGDEEVGEGRRSWLTIIWAIAQIYEQCGERDG